MNYRINVAKYNPKRDLYQHFFDTTLGDRVSCSRVMGELLGAFPYPGYKVEVSRITTVGEDVTADFQDVVEVKE